MDDILGVVNELPLPNDEPPKFEEYQSIVPAFAVAPKVTVPASQLKPDVTPDIAGLGFIVMVIVEVLEHPPEVPVTVYVIVDVGEAVTGLPELGLNDVVGVHE